MSHCSAFIASVNGSVANVVRAGKKSLRMRIEQQTSTGLESKDAIRLSVAYTYCGFEQTSNAVRGSVRDRELRTRPSARTKLERRPSFVRSDHLSIPLSATELTKSAPRPYRSKLSAV